MLTVNRVPADGDKPEMVSASFVYIKPTTEVIAALEQAFPEGIPEDVAVQVSSTRALNYLQWIQAESADAYVRTEMDLALRNLFDHLRTESISSLAQTEANRPAVEVVPDDEVEVV